MIKNALILEAVQEQLGKDIITNEDILSITKLDLSNKSLTEVQDLTQFKNLETLILTENCLNDLSPISELTSLKELRAGNDPFLSDEEMASRKGKNHFTDYSFLTKLTDLTHVCFTDSDIANIEFVKMLPNLVQFWAYCNPIKDISPLENCQKLYKAYFFACPISDISVCRKIPSLCGIAINGTGVSDLSPLEGHVDFVYLDAHNAQISDISAIANMTKMNYLTLVGNYISDIIPLLKMQELQWLTLEINNYLSFEQIASVLPELKRLDTVALANCNFSEEQKQILVQKMSSVNIRFNECGVW